MIWDKSALFLVYAKHYSKMNWNIKSSKFKFNINWFLIQKSCNCIYYNNYYIRLVKKTQYIFTFKRK